jgi:anti-anti-sigma factor
MEALLFTAAPRELVLDFEGIAFMDSSGIRTIVELSSRLRDRNGVLVLQSIPETPRRVLEVSGLTEHLEMR